MHGETLAGFAGLCESARMRSARFSGLAWARRAGSCNSCERSDACDSTRTEIAAAQPDRLASSRAQ
jgi:hypothetical protein